MREGDVGWRETREREARRRVLVPSLAACTLRRQRNVRATVIRDVTAHTSRGTAVGEAAILIWAWLRLVSGEGPI